MPRNAPSEVADALRRGLLVASRRSLAGVRSVSDPTRLSGGASAETWAFDLTIGEQATPCILRRSSSPTTPGRLSRSDEARLQQLAAERGVAAARVVFVLGEADGLGEGYVMERIPGETLAPKILRDDLYAGARSAMAAQCGEVAARIHALEGGELPSLEWLPADRQLRRYRDQYDDYDDPHPVFEWAFRWLEERLPEDGSVAVPVHGDFRLGNFVVGESGLRAVLDWELAHRGDPMEDLGWLCVRSWRFGRLENPVGGFGTREQLWAAYESAGGTVDRERARFWEVFGSLKWGVMCMSQGFAHLRGQVRSVERAAIGRRASETEIDLLQTLLGESA